MVPLAVLQGETWKALESASTPPVLDPLCRLSRTLGQALALLLSCSTAVCCSSAVPAVIPISPVGTATATDDHALILLPSRFHGRVSRAVRESIMTRWNWN
jgi:hypothetical protein